MRKIVLAAAGAFMATGAVAAEHDITVISFGRADQQALSKAYYEPFTAATGIKVNSQSYDGETTELAQMAKTRKTVWDVIQVESRALRLGCENGLFEKLDYSRIGSKADFIPGAVSACGVGIFAWSVALAYDSAKLKTTPRSWSDFWNTTQFPGKRGLRRSAKYTLEIALLADGVKPDDVYRTLGTKQGVDRAFRKLDQIKRSIIWWQAAADPALFLDAGRFVMTSAYTQWIEREQPYHHELQIAWDGSLYDVDSWAIPKGTPKLADAYRFLAFASQPENQKVLSLEMGYGPSNGKALPLLDAPVIARTASSEAHLAQALEVDTGFWIKHGDALEKRFDRWAPQLCVQDIDDDDEYEVQDECQDAQGNLRKLPTKPNPRGE